MFENRFLGKRDPVSGRGLHISEVTGDFEKVHEEISDNCLELIASDEAVPCVALYPLKDGRMVGAVAKKVQSRHLKESRRSEIIRGVIMESKVETLQFYRMLGENLAAEMFFPSEEPLETIGSLKGMPEITESDINGDRLMSYLKSLGYDGIMAFHNAILKVHRKKVKVHLIVPDDKCELVMAACCKEASNSDRALFILANGECTSKNPDILIGRRELVHQNPNYYKRMTMNEFLEFGRELEFSWLLSDSRDGEAERTPEPEEELVRFCMEYLVTPTISDFELYDAADTLYEKDKVTYNRFKRMLRKELFYHMNTRKSLDRCMKLLYICYKKDELDVWSSGLEGAPYDFCGMYAFLYKKHGDNKHELKRCLEAMVTLQFQENLRFLSEDAVFEAGRTAVRKIPGKCGFIIRKNVSGKKY